MASDSDSTIFSDQHRLPRQADREFVKKKDDGRIEVGVSIVVTLLLSSLVFLCLLAGNEQLGRDS